MFNKNDHVKSLVMKGELNEDITGRIVSMYLDDDNNAVYTVQYDKPDFSIPAEYRSYFFVARVFELELINV